ncbi:MAG: twin-arginine translocase TatA/TatE family subunit [Candidatus Hodarchaeota archaeon]
MTLGLQELIFILVILLIVFGPKKLPEIARDLGKAYQEFKKASNGVVEKVSSELKTELEDTRKIVKNLDIDAEVKNISTTLDVEAEGQSIKRVIDEINNKDTE